MDASARLDWGGTSNLGVANMMSDLKITSMGAHRVLVIDDKDVIRYAFVISKGWRIQLSEEG